MALQLYSATVVLQSAASRGIAVSRQPAVVGVAADYPKLSGRRRERRWLSADFRVRSCLEAKAVVAEVGRVTEVMHDTFWPIVNAYGSKVVVLDMYNQQCGPCKVIAPKYQLLSEKYTDVLFLKLDCNMENRPLAKELGIRVVPTFKILKDGKIIKEITGAKYDDLVAAIEAARSL